MGRRAPEGGGRVDAVGVRFTASCRYLPTLSTDLVNLSTLYHAVAPLATPLPSRIFGREREPVVDVGYGCRMQIRKPDPTDPSDEEWASPPPPGADG